ncbi:universal stress protein A-like protein [Typha latifolia]|uniref:universal stress protein A-like protein n=1 Tax=Typha latifolia TaxID=4733 RepID=UPI003C2D41A7
MVAIDESECSYHALEWALDNLSSDALLVLLNVQRFPTPSHVSASAACPPVTKYIFVATAPELVPSLQEHQKKVSLALLERAKKICCKNGVVPETYTEVGDPKEAICSAIEKHKINLLIVGTHGKGVLRRILLGSISNYCTNNAKCPVLVVKK